MANYDQRITINNAFGQLGGGVDALATILTSTGFTALPTLTTASVEDYVPLVLADDSLGLAEIIWVTGHAAGSQSVTVVRGREGTAGRTWGAGTLWRCAPTIRDGLPVLTRAQLPADANLGARVMLSDEARVVERVAAGWKATELIFGHAGRTAGFQASPADPVVITAAQDLTGGMALSNNGLVVPIAGRYLLTMCALATGPSGYRWIATLRRNGLSWAASPTVRTWKGSSADFVDVHSAVRPLDAGDRITLYVSGDASTGSTWGTDGYNGSWIEAQYVGP